MLLEAQASGLPVVAVAKGGPALARRARRDGPARAGQRRPLADALLAIVNAPLLAERLRRGGLGAVAQRTWDASLQQLADGYRAALVASPLRTRSVA